MKRDHLVLALNILLTVCVVSAFFLFPIEGSAQVAGGVVNFGFPVDKGEGISRGNAMAIDGKNIYFAYYYLGDLPSGRPGEVMYEAFPLILTCPPSLKCGFTPPIPTTVDVLTPLPSGANPGPYTNLFAYTIGIAVDPSGVPHIVYQDGVSGLKHAELCPCADDPTLIGWLTESIPMPAGFYVSMAVDKTGTVHVVSSSGSVISYTTKSNGVWSPVENIVGPAALSSLSLAVDSHGNPQVLFADHRSTFNELVYALRGSGPVFWNSGNFEIVSSDDAAWASLAIDGNDAPALSYWGWQTNTSLTAELVYATRLSPGVWSPQSVDSFDFPCCISSLRFHMTSLGFSPTNFPRISYAYDYATSSGVALARLDGFGFGIVPLESDPLGGLNSTSLVMDKFDVSHVLYVVSDCPPSQLCSDTLEYERISSANTPIGAPVTLNLGDPASSGIPITVTFSNVSQVGVTTVAVVDPTAGPAPPPNFGLGNPPIYYDFSTTATYAPPVRVCIPFGSVSNPSSLVIMHYENGLWVDRTAFVDLAHGVICADVSSFSPIAIFQPTTTTAPLNTIVTSSANSSVYGQAVTLTASLTGSGTQGALVPVPTGTIAFFDGATPLGSPFMLSGTASAALTISTLTAGTHTITAQYSGDSNYAPSSSSGFAQTVNPATTSLSLSTSANPSVAGQTITLTSALVGTASGSPGVLSPTGSVTFLDGGTPLGSPVPLSTSGSAAFMTSTLASGTHTITAQYTGDTNYSGSSSSPITQTVNKSPTSTTLDSSSTSPAVGQAITLTSAVSNVGTGSVPAGIPAPTGFVTFLDGSTPLASAVPLPSSGPATLTLSTLAAGTHTLTAQYSGDGFYSSSTSPVFIEIVNGSVSTITTISETNVIYGTASSVTVTVIPSSGSTTVTGNVTLSVDGGAPSSAVLSVGSATFNLGVLKAGNHSLVANFAAQGSFTSSSGQATLVVTQASPTITWATPAPITYGTVLGAAQLNAASVPGTFTYTPAAGTLLSAGSHTLSTTFTPSDTVDYAGATAQVTITVTPALLTITANNATKLLNATNPTFTWTPSGFVNGDTASVLTANPICTTAAGTNSPVGSYSITCSGASAVNYSFAYVPGTLKIQYATAIGHVIQPPINADGTSVLKQGRTVPAKFSVYDANGVSIGTPGVVSNFYLTGIQSGTATNAVQDVVDTNNPDTAFRWDPTSQQWIFNIATANLTAGSTYIYTITLNDGSTILFQYGLR